MHRVPHLRVIIKLAMTKIKETIHSKSKLKETKINQIEPNKKNKHITKRKEAEENSMENTWKYLTKNKRDENKLDLTQRKGDEKKLRQPCCYT